MDIIQTATKIATRLVPHFGKSKTIIQSETFGASRTDTV
jgi:hypothetical protein